MDRAKPDKHSGRAMDGLLQHALRSAAAPSTPCPDPEIHAAYCDRSLDDREIAEYESHLSECASCREVQQALAGAHVPGTTVEGEKSHSRWAWMWDWRWIVPATAVLALALVWYAWRPETGSTRVAELPQLAMSRSEEAPAPALPESEPAPAPTTPAPLAQKFSDALKKTQPQESYSRPSAANAPTESEARELAQRKAAGDLASNLENDVAQKEKETSSSGVGTSAAPEPAEHPQIPEQRAQAAGPEPKAEAAPSAIQPAASAPSNKMQPAPSAALSRNANQGIADRLTGAFIRTPNPQVLWRIGPPGFVERSTDGGATWMGQTLNARPQLTAGSAPTERDCWLVGRDGAILRTTNAADWQTIRPPANTTFTRITATGALEATVTATDGRKFATSDGGVSWTPAP